MAGRIKEYTQDGNLFLKTWQILLIPVVAALLLGLSLIDHRLSRLDGTILLGGCGVSSFVNCRHYSRQ